MPQFFPFIASLLFFASDDSQIDHLLGLTGKGYIERVSTDSHFFEHSLTTQAENDNPDYVGELNEKEVGEILDQHKQEVVAESSLKGVIEKETASQLQMEENDEIAASSPTTEDLSIFVKQPHVTISEPTKVEDRRYDQLVITHEERQKISNLLNTMAENNVFKLLFEKKRLERLGQELNHVHPVKFLGTVFTDPRLVYCMHKIRTSGFKWGGFIDGFSMRFRQELNGNNVTPFIPGLAQELNISATDIQGYINHQDIEGLILFLMEKKRK